MKSAFAALPALASALVATTAMAADIPVALPVRAPAIAPVPAYNWTGLYVGANGGYGWGAARAATLGVAESINLKGPFVGGQVGANWQTGMLVLGVEVDGQWADIKASQTDAGLTVTERIRSFFTARARVGVAASNWLVYATGGFAYSTFEVQAALLGVMASERQNRAGWTAGGGLELGFGQWSLKTEYLYLRSSDRTDDLLGVPITTRWDSHLARVGLNYRFPAGPISVMY